LLTFYYLVLPQNTQFFHQDYCNSTAGFSGLSILFSFEIAATSLASYPLTPRKQPSGKIITTWVFEGDCDASVIKSNTFLMEWPQGSDRQQEFPEVDRAGFFSFLVAKEKIIKGQSGFLDELTQILK